MYSVNQLAASRGYDNPHILDRRVRIPHNNDLAGPRPCLACELAVVLQTPLAGHRGDCAKVLQATVSGKMDAPCDCGHISA